MGDTFGPGSALIRLQALRSLAGIRCDPYRGELQLIFYKFGTSYNVISQISSIQCKYNV